MLVVQEESLSNGTDAHGQGEVPQTVLQVLPLQTGSQVCAGVGVGARAGVCAHVYVCACVRVRVCV